jgi:hypothetical protein
MLSSTVVLALACSQVRALHELGDDRAVAKSTGRTAISMRPCPFANSARRRLSEPRRELSDAMRSRVPVQSRANTRHMQRRRTDARCGSPLARSARPLERCGRPDGAAGRAGRPGARKAALTRPHRALLTRLSHDPCPCHLASRPRPTLEKYSPFLVRRPLVLRSDLLISVIASTEIGALSTGITQLTDHTLPPPLCTNC